MYILAVDPGVQTGVALLNPEGEIVWTLTSEAPYDELRSALQEYREADVAMEATPNSRHMQDVYRMNLAVCEGRTVHFIRPSEWKSHPFCRVPVSDYETKHEAEAVGIGRAYLLRRKREQSDSAGASPDRVDQESSGHLGDRAGSV